VGAVHLQSATLGYGRNAVLHAINLAIPAGDFVVVGGPNGGGKSTLLKGIAGLLPLLEGTRSVNGVRFGYVPQQAAAEAPLPITALELVELGDLGATAGGRRARPFHLQCLRECRAEALAHRPFGQLSGGQRQRVLLARALAACPNVLLLDEPTAGVDVETQLMLAERLSLANREEGMSVIVVTHEPAVFDGIARRTLVVSAGNICEQP